MNLEYEIGLYTLYKVLQWLYSLVLGFSQTCVYRNDVSELKLDRAVLFEQRLLPLVLRQTPPVEDFVPLCIRTRLEYRQDV